MLSIPYHRLMPLNIAIAGHSMKIVEIEGTNTEPFVTSNFTIGPGENIDHVFVSFAHIFVFKISNIPVMLHSLNRPAYLSSA